MRDQGSWRRLRRLVLGATLALALSAALAGPPLEGRPLYEALGRVAAQASSPPAVVAEAEYHQGMLLNNGAGLPRDLAGALAHFRRGAELGDAQAAYKLGCYHAGQFPGVVPVDEEQALRWKLVAAEAGYALAQSDVALVLLRRGDAEAGQRWARAAAEQGFVPAMGLLGMTLSSGRGAPRDEPQALTWAYRANHAMGSRVPERSREALRQMWAESPAEQRGALARAAAAWRPQPTALTRQANEGLRVAQRLAGRAPPP